MDTPTPPLSTVSHHGGVTIPSPGEPAGFPLKKPDEIILVIPAYNDGSTLGSVLIKARPHVTRIIVVDDCSHDRTMDVAKLSRAEIIRFQQPSGRGAACIEGLKRAYQLGCSIAILIGGDARYRTREIPWLISPIQIGDADVVIGSRYLEADCTTPVRQLIVQDSIHLSDSEKNTPKITDPLSGFVALNRKALEDLNFTFAPGDFRQKFTEHLINRKLSIHEVAVTERPGIPKKVVWDDSIKVIAALPAYNEEDCVAKIIVAAENQVDTVMVVDDGSADQTALIARRMGAYVVSHGKNRGYGAALQTIFANAKTLNLEAVVILDADGQHNPDDIQKLLLALEKNKADVVIGSRFIEENPKNIPGYRKVGMKILDGATHEAGVAEITDSQSGFRAYGRKAIDVINLSGNGMSAGSEILIQISDHKLKIVEVPIVVRYDIEGTSSENPLSHGVSVLYRIIGLLSYRRPLPAFGIPGLVLVILGLVFGFWAFSDYYTTSKFSFAQSMGSVLFLILGSLAIFMGLILNYLVVFVQKQKTGE